MDAELLTPAAQIITLSMGDFLDLRGQSSPGTAFKFANSDSMGLTTLDSKPYVDRAAMSARAIISTATVDRVGDSLVPMGCNLKNYAKNPVVLWGHGIEGVTLPIGTSADPDGNLAVEITEDAVIATSFFSQKSLEAAQIFELIDDGTVRATSVRETPLKHRLVRNKSGQMVMVADEWELEEWSWCAIGVNPDAVAKAIGKNRLAGKPIRASIMKSLKAVAPPKKPKGKGFTEKKSMAQEPDGDEMTTPAEDVQDSPEQQPYGSQVLAAAHGVLKQAVSNLDQAIGPCENEPVKTYLQGLASRLKDELTGLSGCHTESYPGSKCFKEDMADDEYSDSEMKAFLAQGKTAVYPLVGLATQLKSLASAENMLPAQSVRLMEFAGSCERWAAKAKSMKAAIETQPPPPDNSKELEALSARLAKLST